MTAYLAKSRFISVLLFLGGLLLLIAYGVGRLQAAPAFAVIPACTPITTNTTWTTGNIYVVQDCNLTVAAGATLTIQPGVVVKFGGTVPGSGSALGSAAMIVDGALNAIGTSAQPVIFTSLADDAHGGDTNGGGASSGAAGDWYGIIFQANSSGQLEHFFLGYGGSGVFNNPLGYGRGQVDVRQAAVQLYNGEITAGKTAGIYLEGAGLTPSIQDVSVADNRAANSRGFAIYQSTINMQPTYSNLTFTGNDRDAVIIGNFGEAMTQNVTVGGANYGVTCGYTICQLSVPAGYTLTVQPGTVWDFGWDGYPRGLAVASGGALIAEGTPAQPVIFTSGQQTAHYWPGIWAQQGSTLRLDHCDISYADDSNYGLGGLEINTDDAQVQNCRIHHNRRNGLYIYSRNGASIAPGLSNVEVSNNGEHGVYLDTSSGSVNAPTWVGGRVAENGYSGVYVDNFAGAGIMQATLHDLTISGNGSATDGSAGRSAGIYAPDPNTSLALDNLTLTNNAGIALFWQCNGSILARGLTATGNTPNELLIPGCNLSGGRQWDLGDAGIPARVTGAINVTPNALLSIQPGTELRFDKNQYNSPIRLEVQDQASLNALGTADRPIIFTGATATPGWWEGIYAKQRATLTLRHCEIGYGGANTTGSLLVSWGWPNTGIPTANIQNCEVHDSSRKGVHFDFNNFSPIAALPVFRYNHFHDNAEEAVANRNAPPLDARQNYWGDPTGPYHATQNPGGLGDNVGDNILFYPWLATPSGGGDAPGQMLVSTGAPNLVSPGETVDYAIQYLNGMTETVHGSVLLIQLPKAAAYLESTHGGIYWPQRHQVFWLLGDVAPGSQAFVTARVRFDWGLPRGYTDGSMTLFSGSNYNPDVLERAVYEAYVADEAESSVHIPQGEFDALRAANPDLETLYQEAIGEGYAFVDATRSRFRDGGVVTGAFMSTGDRQFSRILALYDGQATATTFGGDLFTMHDVSGGMRFSRSTLESTYWGDWAPDQYTLRTGEAMNTCTPAKCKAHCVGKSVTFTVVTSVARSVVSWATFGLIPPPGAYGTAYTVTKTIRDCKKACDDNPLNGCCNNEGDVRWSPGTFSGWCTKEYCNATTGTYGTPGQLFCATGTRCVSGTGGKGGCLPCGDAMARYDFKPVMVAESLQTDSKPRCATAASSGGDCSDFDLRVAKDPNAIRGVDGDLLPGQVVTYTITYENVGEGRAYGVYVVNPLPAVFDPATLTFVNHTGVYLPASREILWQIGELGPKGDPDAEGVITYTISLTSGLPSGTVVANQAVVYFLSVPEETPTNTWVNLVAPLVAAPQQLTTDYMTPRSIVLSGREVSGLPLTYAIVEPPRGGVLSGAAPNLTYTPAANFTGPDRFTFQVSNGVSSSRAAQVDIDVMSAGDTTPPQVLWTHPADGATAIDAPATPIFTDTVGAAYAPAILIGVSEPLEASSVNSTTVTLARSSVAVASSASFDGGTNQIVLNPRTALTEGAYTVTVTTDVTDVAGNRLATPTVFHFTVGTPAEGGRIFLPTVQR